MNYKEIHKKSLESDWVDLGLPSGTLWKTKNETNPNESHDFYTYDEAIQQFGSQLPTMAELMELKNKCKWDRSPVEKGYNVVGHNGNYIFIPAEGVLNNYVWFRGQTAIFWSSTSRSSKNALSLCAYPDGVCVSSYPRRYGETIRLVNRNNNKK